MEYITDLHIHSKYSRACSGKITLEGIDASCRKKGVHIISTGDFTFPAWFSEIEEKLEEIGESGLYKLKKAEDDKVRFILSTELALIYKDKGRARRLHLMVNAPDVGSVKRLNEYLGKKYNITSDGRPILGMTAPELVKLCRDIHPDFFVYPAHIWTPWFAVFGSKSGFNSMEECFHDQVEYIHAYETGLSSDPEMNWRLSALDNYTLLSSSDAHSLPNIGREATVFDLEEASFKEIYEAIKNKNAGKVKYTIEFYPEEGMYHYDGHRNCGIRFTPEETKKNKGICPVCKKPLTVGVMYRVDELADRQLGYRPEGAPSYIKLTGLAKIIAEAFGVKSANSQKVLTEYENLIKNVGDEISVLKDIDPERLKEAAHPAIAEGIKRMRDMDLTVEPGFDGQYGHVKIFDPAELRGEQKKLI
ncbi:MAG: endonuclease Q family protein [Patescibacteria group bacterium]